MAAGAQTIVYIDALNLYYGAAKGTANKWLDLEAFCRALLPHDTIVKIRYFTAPVKPKYPGDKSHQRQNAYIRALETNSLIEIELGHFRMDKRYRTMAIRPSTHVADLFRPRLRPRFVARWLFDRAERRNDRPVAVNVRVLNPEEKGSDVNLASALLVDALTGACDKALLITNDADLERPIALAVAHGVEVGFTNPHRNAGPSRDLKRVAKFYLPFRQETLGKCQLPHTVVAKNGKQVHKPAEW